jgi:hypothetical protein
MYKILLVLLLLILLLCPVPNPYPNMLEKYQNDYKYTTAHFVYGLWDKGEVPEKFANTMKLWEKQGWTIKLWDGDMVDALLDKYPRYKEILPSLGRKVQKADLARLLILYDEGGHYFDLDCVPTERNLFQYLNAHNPPAIFYVERTLCLAQYLMSIFYPIRNFKPETLVRIANYSFGAMPQNETILKNLELLRERCLKFSDYDGDYDVLFKTGPDCTTHATHALAWENRAILPHSPWMKHVCAGSWRNSKDV